jgi:flavin reductase (DIM6/NTAB) family NADH-FMN oxidoreductase RutF
MSSTEPVPALPPRQFRNALGSYATGVAIVTARDGNGGFVGMTINSFASVSLDPPLVLWSVQLNSPSSAAFRQAERFAVSILCTEHQALAKRFASNEADRFADAPMRRSPSGLPVVENALTVFDCRTVARYAGGDHEILVGHVEALEAREDAEATALGFYRGKFLPVS